MNKTIITMLSIIVIMIAVFTAIVIYKANNKEESSIKEPELYVE